MCTYPGCPRHAAVVVTVGADVHEVCTTHARHYAEPTLHSRRR